MIEELQHKCVILDCNKKIPVILITVKVGSLRPDTPSIFRAEMQAKTKRPLY